MAIVDEEQLRQLVWLKREESLDQSVQAMVKFKAVLALIRVVRSGGGCRLAGDTIIINNCVVFVIREETHFTHSSL